MSDDRCVDWCLRRVVYNGQRLEEMGCLALDVERVKAAVKDGLLLSSDLAPFVRKVPRTASLMVEEVK